MVGLIRICGFGIPHNLPPRGPQKQRQGQGQGQRQPPSGPGPASLPAPADAPPKPKEGHRVRYVVIAVEKAATYHDRRGTPVETDWRIVMRRADQGVPPRYVYYVEQWAELPPPAAIHAIIELDPRLVALETDA